MWQERTGDSGSEVSKPLLALSVPYDYLYFEIIRKS